MNAEPPGTYSGPFSGMSVQRGLASASVFLVIEATVWGTLSFFLPNGWWHIVINILFFVLGAAGGVEIKNWLAALGKPSWAAYTVGLVVFYVAVIVWRSIFMGVLEGTLTAAP